MTLIYLHWNEAELIQRIVPLKGNGFKVIAHWNSSLQFKLKDRLPEVFIISLDRLPSHGVEYAQWFWEAKKRRHIPIVFVGGEAAKVEAIRRKFPNAHFCQGDELLNVIREIPSLK